MLTNALYIILAILMLSVLIVIHELGHFAVGRICGIGVVEFSVGMGPKLFSRKRNGIEYSIRAFPIGGFCRFVGEDEDSTAANAMNNMPVWKRFLTVLAGPGMNFLLAFVVAAIIMMAFPYADGVVPVIDQVSEGTPAFEASLLTGDTILEVNGIPVSYDNDGIMQIREAIQSNDTVTFTVKRGSEIFPITLKPAVVTLEDGSTTKQVGIQFSYTYSRYSFFGALGNAGRVMHNTTEQMLGILKNLIFKGEGAENMAGAVGTIAVVSKTLKTDLSLIFDYMFLISLNLGIMNLIPFPGLDGSRLLFLLIEAIRRQPVPPEKEGMVHAIGLVLLLGLMIVLAWHDIVTYIL